MTRIEVDGIVAEQGEKAHGFINVGEWQDGSPVRIPIIVVNGRKQGPKLLMIGGTDGDEVVSTEAVKRTTSVVNPEKLTGSIVAAPVLNIPAFIYNERYDTLNPYHEDMSDLVKNANRIQPEAAMPHRVAQVVNSKLLPGSSCLLDFHSSAKGSVNYPRMILTPAYAKISAELRKRIDDIGAASGIELLFRAKATKWAGQYFEISTGIPEQYGIPSLVLETGAAPTIEGADELVTATLNIMKSLGMLEGKPELDKKPIFVDKIIAVRANRGGIVRMKVKLRQGVFKGDPIAVVTNLFDEVVEEIKAPQDGIVVKIATQGFCNTGYRVCALAIPE